MMVRQHPGTNLLVPTSWMSCFVLLLDQDIQSPAPSTPTDCGMSAASDVPLLLCKERRALTFNHLEVSRITTPTKLERSKPSTKLLQ